MYCGMGIFGFILFGIHSIYIYRFISLTKNGEVSEIFQILFHLTLSSLYETLMILMFDILVVP